MESSVGFCTATETLIAEGAACPDDSDAGHLRHCEVTIREPRPSCLAPLASSCGSTQRRTLPVTPSTHHRSARAFSSSTESSSQTRSS